MTPRNRRGCTDFIDEDGLGSTQDATIWGGGAETAELISGWDRRDCSGRETEAEEIASTDPRTVGRLGLSTVTTPKAMEDFHRVFYDWMKCGSNLLQLHLAESRLRPYEL